MLSFLRRTADLIDSINDKVGKAVSWLTLFMVVVAFVAVMLRYFFDINFIAVQESITYMHAAVFMLGAAYTLKDNEHVRVDIFYNKMSVKGKAWVDMLGSLFFLLPVCIYIIIMCWSYVLLSWKIAEGSNDPGGLPIVYILKSLLIIMPVLLLLQGLSIAAKNLIKIINNQSDENQSSTTNSVEV